MCGLYAHNFPSYGQFGFCGSTCSGAFAFLRKLLVPASDCVLGSGCACPTRTHSCRGQRTHPSPVRTFAAFRSNQAQPSTPPFQNLTVLVWIGGKRPFDQLTSDSPFPPLHTQTNHTNQLAHPHYPLHTLFSPSRALLGAKGEGGGNICPTHRGTTAQRHKHQRKGFSSPSPPPHTPAHPPLP
jgi:hypothetical protein